MFLQRHTLFPGTGTKFVLILHNCRVRAWKSCKTNRTYRVTYNAVRIHNFRVTFDLSEAQIYLAFRQQQQKALAKPSKHMVMYYIFCENSLWMSGKYKLAARRVHGITAKNLSGVLHFPTTKVSGGHLFVLYTNSVGSTVYFWPYWIYGYRRI